MARRWALGVVFAVLALSVGWARVYLGLHFPFDILGSILVSLCGTLIVFRIWAKWGTRIITPVERLYRKLLAAPIRRGWFRP